MCDGWVVGRGGGLDGCCPPSLIFPVVGRKCASIMCSYMFARARVEVVGWEGVTIGGGGGGYGYGVCTVWGYLRSLGVVSYGFLLCVW